MARSVSAASSSGIEFERERGAALEVVAVHDGDVHEADGLEGAPHDIQGALARVISGGSSVVNLRAEDRPARDRRPACARTANPAPSPAAPSRSAPSPTACCRVLASVTLHLDKAVAGVVEIAAADRDIVVEPGRRGRIDRKQRGRHRLVFGVRRKRRTIALWHDRRSGDPRESGNSPGSTCSVVRLASLRSGP